ncbi:transmembrane protease serine 9-like [Anopheles nili]|uniref:transmembrane protease serine 9-like n=1 Tax=Anopheles nili TaxID=185578 RepID=UPI00237B0BFE|nr:transmembrane protease serine 9-like [Anopheles nili]
MTAMANQRSRTIANDRVGGGRNILTLVLLVVLSGPALLLLADDQIQHASDEMLYDGDACVLRNGTAGICRPANRCDWVMEKPHPTQELITCSFNWSLPIVCCPVRVEARITSEPPATPPPAVGTRAAEVHCQRPSGGSGLSDHIFKGVFAQYGDFPYIAALAFEPPNGTAPAGGTRFGCGASLISSTYLLTAAHCASKKPAFARLGVLELEPAIVVDEPLDIAIANVTLHPAYNRISYEHDIALLELAEAVPNDLPFVRPVCLHTNTSESYPLDPNQLLWIAGWGAQEPDDDKKPPPLLKANVSLIARADCSTSLPRTRFNPNGPHPSQLCALGRNMKNETTADTCPGDSGGPVELTVHARHYLVGVTSLGYPCGSPYPGLYTAVEPYLDWIESIVWPDGCHAMCWIHQHRGELLVLVGLAGMVCVAVALPQPSTIFEDTTLYEGDTCSLPGMPAGTGVCRKAMVCPQGIRFNGDRCEFSGNDPVVCCPGPNTPKRSDAAVNRITTRISKQECERINSRSGSLSSHVSGRRLEATLGEFPFMAYVNFGPEAGISCGAALIAKRFLLSAAHCYNSTGTPVSVLLAMVRLGDAERDEYQVRTVHIHSGYKHRRNDLALIELTRDVVFDTNVNPICLNTDLLDIGSTVNLTIMGWGVNGDGEATDKLWKATVKEVQVDQCQTQFREHKLGISIGQNHVCALGEKWMDEFTDACTGDSGGPLVMQVQSKFFLVGVVSTGPPCGSNLPGVYTRVSSYLDWIEEIVWQSKQ